MIDIPTILGELQRHYDDAVRTLREDVIAFGRDGTLPPPARRTDGSYAYPQITLRYNGVGGQRDRSRAISADAAVAHDLQRALARGGAEKHALHLAGDQKARSGHQAPAFGPPAAAIRSIAGARGSIATAM